MKRIKMLMRTLCMLREKNCFVMFIYKQRNYERMNNEKLLDPFNLDVTLNVQK